MFDENTPNFFASNERLDYLSFLDSLPTDYEVCLSEESIVGAFGLIGEESAYKNINWILISPSFQGLGIGSIVMNRVISIAHHKKLKFIKIAASHLFSPFFAKYGAECIVEIKDGWGVGMNRIDMKLHL